MKHYAAVRRVLWYTMALNLLVTAAKLLVGYLTGSLSLIADGFDSFFNSVSNVVGLVGIAVASRPPDAGHPYGHRKFETLSAASITILLFLTTVQLAQSAFERLRHPQQPEVNVWTAVAIVASIGVHLYVAWYEGRRGRELKSEFLVADAMHTRADVLVSVSVGVGMIVVRLGYPAVDAILALVIAGLIAKIGIDIIRSSSKILADAAVVDTRLVEQVVSQVPGVQSVHHIRSRGQEDDIHLDLHVRVGQGMPVEEAHAIAHQVQGALLAAIAGLQDVVVHVEPQPGAAPAEATLDRRIRKVAGHIPNTAVHNVQAHEIDGHLYITLHLEVERSLAIEQAHDLASRLEAMLQREIPQTASVRVHIEPAGDRAGLAGAADEPTYRQVRAALERATGEVPGLSGCHDLVVSRRAGQLLVSAHWECDAALSVEEAHTLSQELEQRAQAHLPRPARVTVHVEPRPTA
jgi:cation diffusion facilitator family transporter